MKKHIYSGFRYKLLSNSMGKLRCVEVSFFCDYYPAKRFIFILDREGVDYIAEAKKIIASEIESGKLCKNCIESF